MHEPNPIHAPSHARRNTATGIRLRQLLVKPIWIPRAIYEALPAIYAVCGLIALAAALFLPGRAWIFPWIVVFSFAALHLGLGIAALRHRIRKKLRPATRPPEQ